MERKTSESWEAVNAATTKTGWQAESVWPSLSGGNKTNLKLAFVPERTLSLSQGKEVIGRMERLQLIFGKDLCGGLVQ